MAGCFWDALIARVWLSLLLLKMFTADQGYTKGVDNHDTNVIHLFNLSYLEFRLKRKKV